MDKKSYSKYRASKEWQAKRKEKLKEANYQCEKCGTAKNLNVHHLNYAHLGFEDLDELVVLCKKCHEQIHENDNIKSEKTFGDFIDKYIFLVFISGALLMFLGIYFPKDLDKIIPPQIMGNVFLFYFVILSSPLWLPIIFIVAWKIIKFILPIIIMLILELIKSIKKKF
jgi:hypothetical protein